LRDRRRAAAREMAHLRCGRALRRVSEDGPQGLLRTHELSFHTHPPLGSSEQS
jgi:hypothetical protein